MIGFMLKNKESAFRQLCIAQFHPFLEHFYKLYMRQRFFGNKQIECDQHAAEHAEDKTEDKRE